jgi:hypothetical protein
MEAVKRTEQGGVLGREARRAGLCEVADAWGVHGVWLRLAELAAAAPTEGGQEPGDPAGPAKMELALDMAQVGGWGWLRTAATLSALLHWEAAARALGVAPDALREMSLPEVAMLVRLRDLAAGRGCDSQARPAGPAAAGTEQGPPNDG